LAADPKITEAESVLLKKAKAALEDQKRIIIKYLKDTSILYKIIKCDLGSEIGIYARDARANDKLTMSEYKEISELMIMPWYGLPGNNKKK
jgi:hypothetical protein